MPQSLIVGWFERAIAASQTEKYHCEAPATLFTHRSRSREYLVRVFTPSRSSGSRGHNAPELWMGADLISHFSMGESVFDAVELAPLHKSGSRYSAS